MACPICDDTGWKTIEVDGVSRATRCDCWHQRSFESLLKSARIPRRYVHCELSNFEAHTDSQRDALRRATRLVDQFPVADKGLLFFGDTIWVFLHQSKAVLAMVGLACLVPLVVVGTGLRAAVESKKWIAILSLVVFFAVGLVLVMFVNVAKANQAARPLTRNPLPA